MHHALRINLLCRAGLSSLVLIACFGSSGCSSSASSGSTTPTPPVSSVTAPTISPTNTTVSGNTPVYITDTESGTTIIYTLNGSTPSAINGTTCTASATTPCFTLLGGATINAVAQDSSGSISTVTTQTYTANTASANSCAGWNPQVEYAVSDFSAHQATITSQGVTLGADCNGGGYVDYLNMGSDANGNLIAIAYGRGFQSDLRDSLHSSFYNPTQAGIIDGVGTPVTLTLTPSSEGPGGRINIAPYSLPLFLNPGFCFFPLSYYDPSATNPIPSCNTSTVTNGIFTQEQSANISGNQQLASEFSFQGFYQDASNLGGNTASIFEYDFMLTYLQDPGGTVNPGATTWQTPQTSSNFSPIYEFGPAATYATPTNPNTPVLKNTASYEGLQAYSNVASSNSLSTVTLTDIDLGIGQFDTGMRIQLNAGYTDYLTLNSTCTGWSNPQPVNLQTGGLVYHAYITPGTATSPCASVVALENPSQPNTIIAMYLPQTDPVNAQQITETDVTTGKSITLDRRVSTVPSYMGITSYAPVAAPNTETLNGVTYNAKFTTIVPVVRFSGLLAPNHAGPNIDESVTCDVFLLVGSPAQVLTALQTMNQSQGWNW